MGENVGQLTLAGIARRCARESERFFEQQPHDPRFCFELFRRAFLRRDQVAWEYLYIQYEPLVLSWVHRHESFRFTGEEAPYFVNRAFEKMWNGLTAERFRRFEDLAALLRYLQMCVHSVIVDFVRLAEHDTYQAAVDDPDMARLAAETDVETRVDGRLQSQAIWSLLLEQLNDPQEERLCYATFVLGLKPREIYEHFGDHFNDIDDVYRTKENVMARLRRDKAFQQALARHA